MEDHPELELLELARQHPELTIETRGEGLLPLDLRGVHVLAQTLARESLAEEAAR